MAARTPRLRERELDERTARALAAFRRGAITEERLDELLAEIKHERENPRPPGPKKPSWASIRRAVIARDKRCQKCGARDGLEAHHKHERAKGGPDTLENLIALCGLCHDEWTYAESMPFEDWLLVPPARLIVPVFALPWPEDVSAADFKFELLRLLDRVLEPKR